MLSCPAKNQCNVHDPRVDGGFRAERGGNVPEWGKRPDRPPRFLNQVSPLTPGSVLADAVFGLAPADEAGVR